MGWRILVFYPEPEAWLHLVQCLTRSQDWKAMHIGLWVMVFNVIFSSFCFI